MPNEHMSVVHALSSPRLIIQMQVSALPTCMVRSVWLCKYMQPLGSRVGAPALALVAIILGCLPSLLCILSGSAMQWHRGWLLRAGLQHVAPGTFFLARLSLQACRHQHYFEVMVVIPMVFSPLDCMNNLETM